MFSPEDRYAKLGTYTVSTREGVVVQVTRLPLPLRAPVLGFHRSLEGQRLDLIANRYFTDPTLWWRLCDATDCMTADALAQRELVAIPAKER